MSRRPASVFSAALLSLAAAFFGFYEARLLYVTRGLLSVRSGGNGAYIGAVVFPVLALFLSRGALRCWRASKLESSNRTQAPAP